MINNFELIKSLLQFDSEDDFYFAQVIQRKKEHPSLGSNNHCVQTYYIRSVEHLDRISGEMIALCDHHNARGCINLNRRSFEKCAFQLLQKVTNIIMNKDYKSCRNAYDSVLGVHSNESTKKWIIDIDLHDNYARGQQILQHLEKCSPVGNKNVATIPTKNGYHLIVTPFNKLEYSMMCGDNVEEDIHKDNPTILYIP